MSSSSLYPSSIRPASLEFKTFAFISTSLPLQLSTTSRCSVLSPYRSDTSRHLCLRRTGASHHAVFSTPVCATSSSASSSSSTSVPTTSSTSNPLQLAKLTNAETAADAAIPATNWREILAGIAALAAPLWGGKRRAVAWAWTAATVVLALAVTGYAVMLSMVQKFFWNCLAAKDVSKFGKLLFLYFVVVTIGPFVQASFTWVKARLSLMWRQCLTQHLLSRYFTSLNYYRLSIGDSTLVIDNPDQRMSENVTMFTQRAVTFLTSFGVAVFDLLVFSVILHRIYAPLLYTLVIYATCGTIGIAVAGRDLLRLNRQQVRREADFRFGLVRVRETTESVAFYRGEHAEDSELRRRFSNAVTNAIRVLGLQRTVEFLATCFRFFAQVLPTMVIAPRYFAGHVQLGVISQVYVAFNKVLASLGLFIQEFQSLSEFSAGVRRLKDLSDVLSYTDVEHYEKAKEEEEQAKQKLISSKDYNGNTEERDNDEINVNSSINSGNSIHFTDSISSDNGVTPTTTSKRLNTSTTQSRITCDIDEQGIGPGQLELHDVTVMTPGDKETSRTLACNVTMKVLACERVLIIGESGIGKSSLLRVACGLWTKGSGHVKRPSPSDCLFLPQRPFIMLGTLRDNVIYPRSSSDNIISDDEIVNALRRVNLPFLVDRLQESGESLSRSLSLGEQQRLAFARLAVSTPPPRLVVLDESTSALDLENEQRMYQLIKDTNVTCVSVGNRPSLLDFHDRVLKLKDGGSWSDMTPQEVKEEHRESLK